MVAGVSGPPGQLRPWLRITIMVNKVDRCGHVMKLIRDVLIALESIKIFYGRHTSCRESLQRSHTACRPETRIPSPFSMAAVGLDFNPNTHLIPTENLWESPQNPHTDGTPKSSIPIPHTLCLFVRCHIYCLHVTHSTA